MSWEEDIKLYKAFKKTLNSGDEVTNSRSGNTVKVIDNFSGDDSVVNVAFQAGRKWYFWNISSLKEYAIWSRKKLAFTAMSKT